MSAEAACLGLRAWIESQQNAAVSLKERNVSQCKAGYSHSVDSVNENVRETS